MDQSRRFQCLARPLLGQFARGKVAQLVVNQRQELFGGVRVALPDCGQDAGHLAHGD